ncbi:MAG: polymerase factor sigma-54, partial [Bacteroidota bacterium]
MALFQGFQQKLQQKLSPQQIQLMKLLQVPTAMLEERVKEEIEENPALELGEELPDQAEKELADELPEMEEASAEDEFDVNEPFGEYDEDDIADYRVKEDQVPEIQVQGNSFHPAVSSLHEMLMEQLGLLNLSFDQEKIAEQVIGSIDDDGYLRRDPVSIVDDLAFKQNIIVEEALVEEVIDKIQHFDPPGICARDVRECLLIQLRKKLLLQTSIAVKTAWRIVDFHFDEFTRRHYDKIIKSLDIDEAMLKEALQEIRKLD